MTSSALSVFLFIEAKLYSEALLYLFYIAIGAYGWLVWNKQTNAASDTPKEMSWPVMVFAMILTSVGALGLGYFFRLQTDAARPFVDAATTAMSVVASVLEAHRIVSAWIYWIIVNGLSIWLYADRGLSIYAALMIVYFVTSVYGYSKWRKQWKASL
jgi:nicotinamide mononucleotide transporter